MWAITIVVLVLAIRVAHRKDARLCDGHVRMAISHEHRVQHGVCFGTGSTGAVDDDRRRCAYRLVVVPKEFVTDASGRWLPLEAISDVLAPPPGSDLRQVAYSGAIDPGTVAYVGIVAPAFQHRGGAIQFSLPREPIYTKDIGVPAGVAKDAARERRSSQPG
jgi:hypothetical protein